MRSGFYYSGAILCILFGLVANLTIVAQTQIGSDIDGESEGDLCGNNLSMPDPFTVGIGSPHNDGMGNIAGQTRVFEWIGNNWVQKGNSIFGGSELDQSGFSVFMPDALTIAIGAIGPFAGHVRVYSWVGNLWVQKGQDIDGEAGGDSFGWSVCMPDPNTVAVGAPKNSGTGPEAGHVRVYAWNGIAWAQKGNDIDGEDAYDESGDSISMPDANTIAVGARYNDGTGPEAGHVRIFIWNGNEWLQQGSDIDGEAAGDISGSSVSMPDANTVAVGAYGNDGIGSFAGHVRVYEWIGSVWVQKGFDIDGEAAGDNFGLCVSMPNANTLASGAIGNDDAGSESGHVRIYSWDGTDWVQLGNDIDGEAAQDRSGWWVSMPDPSTVAIGAPNNDGNGFLAGHVRVFTLPSITEVENMFEITSAIYPNPTTGQLILDLAIEYTEVLVIVRDAIGQEVNREVFNQAEPIQLEIDGEGGIYFLEILVKDKTSMVKLVKE